MSLKQRQRAERREAERQATASNSQATVQENISENPGQIDQVDLDAGLNQEVLDDESQQDDINDPLRILERELDVLRAKNEADRVEFETLKAEKDRERREIEAFAREAERQKRELEARVNEYASNESKSHEAVIYHALAAAKAEADHAEYNYAAAMQIGDVAAAAKAQRALARAEANVLKLEDGQQALEAAKANEPQSGRVSAPPPADPVESEISKYTPATQNWLRTHRGDIFSSPQRQDYAYAGHIMAVNAGHAADSPAYWDYLDTHMGYKQAPPPRIATQNVPAITRTITPSAPVSRDAALGSREQMYYATKEDKLTAAELGMSASRYVELKNKIARGEAGKLRFEQV